MKGLKFITALAVLTAVAGLLLPLGAWRVWVYDSLYDSIAGDSLSLVPVQRAGRVMPLSSASADILKSMNGKAAATLGGVKTSPSKWIWKLNASPVDMSEKRFMRTDNRDLQKLLGGDGRYYSRDDFNAVGAKIADAAYERERTPYAESAYAALRADADYSSASRAFGVLLGGEKDAVKSLEKWERAVSEASEEIKSSRASGREPDAAKLVEASNLLKELGAIIEAERADPNGTLRTVPSSRGFITPAQALYDRRSGADSMSVVKSYATIRSAIAAGDSERAFAELAALRKTGEKFSDIDLFRIKFENFINVCEPFFAGMILYGFALLTFAAAGFFPNHSRSFFRAAAVFMMFAIGAHVFGIAARSYIQMRPPVTNLYSSIVFAGAISAFIGIWFFARKKYSSFGAGGAICGFLSLLVAMNMPYSGDTMGMMRAVLNSNFWLTVHVVTIMVGYCGIFLAGFMAEARLVANIFSRGNFGADTGDSARGVYAVLCFGLLFSFAGTMLGGFWADMSWGRFWGWDPKENGALMMVLWTAAVIHCKALKMCSDRIFLSLAVFGNVVAAWAWFGVNMLGVGLHSYGFMQGGWFWFGAFVVSQLLTMPLGFLKYRGTTAEENPLAPKK